MSESGSRTSSTASAEALFIEELTNLCDSESLSEDGLRQLIQRHELTSNHTRRMIVSDYDYFFHAACDNEGVNEEIIRCLLEYFPEAAKATDEDEWLPLHWACNNKNLTIGMVRLLIDAYPASGGSTTKNGLTPLHYLCQNGELNETAAIQILNILIEKYPEAVRQASNGGSLPIHFACLSSSPEFCLVLIEAYPGCEQVIDDVGDLPFHISCAKWDFSTVKRLYYLFPNAINRTTEEGLYPIHLAITGRNANDADTAMAAVEIVKFLLACDPDVITQDIDGQSLLHFACGNEYQNIEAGIQIIKTIFDAHPEAIEHHRIATDFHSFDQQVQAFIIGELEYARQAKDHSVMTTPDDNGRLPLHTALQNNVRLGSIKLLVKGNSSAIRNTDNNFAMPLHIACEYHDCAGVVQYLIELHTLTLEAVDREGNTVLHYACRGAKYENIALLLEKYDAVSVSKRNVDGKLPIELLWENNVVEDRESVEYTDSVFRLLRAHPETLTNVGADDVQTALASCSGHIGNGKRRKFGN